MTLLIRLLLPASRTRTLCPLSLSGRRLQLSLHSHITRRAMGTKDVSHISDITKRIQTNADGSFIRPASSFRDGIEKGGKFEPEKGE